jgi:hypothetical protein
MILVTAFLSTLTLQPISAETTIFRASGTLDEYIALGYDSARIVGGSWSVTINLDGELTFYAHWVEENIIEEIPGTIDTFRLYYDEAPEFDFDGSTCTIPMRLIVSVKMGWDNPVGGFGDPPGPRHFSQSYWPVEISIDSDNIIIVIGGEPYISGTTNAFIT